MSTEDKTNCNEPVLEEGVGEWEGSLNSERDWGEEDMVADMKVDMVADMKVDMVADMKVDMVSTWERLGGGGLAGGAAGEAEGEAGGGGDRSPSFLCWLDYAPRKWKQ